VPTGRADGSALRRVRRSQLFVVLGRVLHHRAALASKWRAARRPRAAPGRRPETGRSNETKNQKKTFANVANVARRRHHCPSREA
jgi:hypothetical protein